MEAYGTMCTNTSSLAVQRERESDEESEDKNAPEPVALAFPGGGIRCAAFCHGVLQHLIEDGGYKIQAVCGTSGGGYTAAAFVHNVWDGMNRQGKSYEESTADFFRTNKMAENAGYMINCKDFGTGFFETVAFIGVLVSFAVLFVLDKVPIWFFIALLFDELFGNTLRQRKSDWSDVKELLIILVSSFVVIWALWLILKLLPKSKLWVLRVKNLFAVAFTALIWLTILIVLVKSEFRPDNYSKDVTVLIIAGVLLFLRPLFSRSPTAVGVIGLTIYLLFVSQLCSWRVFKQPLIGIFSYSEYIWNILLIVSGLMLLFPIQILQRKFLHYYYRWRLQMSFLENSGFLGCTGLHRGASCWGGHATRLTEIQGENLPKYLGLSVLNGWQKTPESPEFHLTTLESGGQLRIVGETEKVCIDIPDVYMVEAMALSGAAVAYRMGIIPNESQRFWQVEFGFGLGNWVTASESVKWKWILTVLGQSMLPILAVVIVVFNVTPLILLGPLGILMVLGTIGILSDPSWRLTAWIYHFQWFLNLHETLGLNMYGGEPVPPEVYLSDGAHGDNMALLPLLARQVHKKIIICDGTEDLKESCVNLVIAINTAREKLRCSFLTVNGGTDIEEEILRFSEDLDQACLRFTVVYHRDGDLGSLTYSDIIYLKPRRGFASHYDFRNDLHGCCCDFCHTKPFAFMDACCGTFPQHITLNQFFTQAQFEQYSLLGYRTSKFYMSKRGDKEESDTEWDRTVSRRHSDVHPLLAV